MNGLVASTIFLIFWLNILRLINAAAKPFAAATIQDIIDQKEIDCQAMSSMKPNDLYTDLAKVLLCLSASKPTTNDAPAYIELIKEYSLLDRVMKQLDYILDGGITPHIDFGGDDDDRLVRIFKTRDIIKKFTEAVASRRAQRADEIAKEDFQRFRTMKPGLERLRLIVKTVLVEKLGFTKGKILLIPNLGADLQTNLSSLDFQKDLNENLYPKIKQNPTLNIFKDQRPLSEQLGPNLPDEKIERIASEIVDPDTLIAYISSVNDMTKGTAEPDAKKVRILLKNLNEKLKNDLKLDENFYYSIAGVDTSKLELGSNFSIFETAVENKLVPNILDRFEITNKELWLKVFKVFSEKKQPIIGGGSLRNDNGTPAIQAFLEYLKSSTDDAEKKKNWASFMDANAFKRIKTDKSLHGPVIDAIKDSHHSFVSKWQDEVDSLMSETHLSDSDHVEFWKNRLVAYLEAKLPVALDSGLNNGRGIIHLFATDSITKVPKDQNSLDKVSIAQYYYTHANLKAIQMKPMDFDPKTIKSITLDENKLEYVVTKLVDVGKSVSADFENAIEVAKRLSIYQTKAGEMKAFPIGADNFKKEYNTATKPSPIPIETYRVSDLEWREIIYTKSYFIPHSIELHNAKKAVKSNPVKKVLYCKETYDKLAILAESTSDPNQPMLPGRMVDHYVDYCLESLKDKQSLSKLILKIQTVALASFRSDIAGSDSGVDSWTESS